MQTLTLLNEKGGVAKTTTATTIAAGLAIRGYQVLLIDTDPQANATDNLQVTFSDALLRLLAQDAEWREVTTTIDPAIYAGDYVSEGALHLMPSHTNNRALPMLLDGNFMYLRERLEEIDGGIDIVIFDTSPTPSMLHGMVYLASDHIVFPTMCEFLSMRGLGSSVKHMTNGNKARQQYGIAPINLLGVQPSIYEATTNNHKDNLVSLHKNFGQRVWSPIHKRTVWRDASQVGKSIFAFAPGHEAELEAWQLIDNVVNNGVA